MERARPSPQAAGDPVASQKMALRRRARVERNSERPGTRADQVSPNCPASKSPRSQRQLGPEHGTPIKLNRQPAPTLVPAHTRAGPMVSEDTNTHSTGKPGPQSMAQSKKSLHQWNTAWGHHKPWQARLEKVYVRTAQPRPHLQGKRWEPKGTGGHSRPAKPINAQHQPRPRHLDSKQHQPNGRTGPK